MIGLVQGIATAAYIEAYGYTVERARKMLDGGTGMVDRDKATEGMRTHYVYKFDDVACYTYPASMLFYREFDSCRLRMS